MFYSPDLILLRNINIHLSCLLECLGLHNNLIVWHMVTFDYKNMKYICVRTSCLTERVIVTHTNVIVWIYLVLVIIVSFDNECLVWWYDPRLYFTWHCWGQIFEFVDNWLYAFADKPSWSIRFTYLFTLDLLVFQVINRYY